MKCYRRPFFAGVLALLLLASGAGRATADDVRHTIKSHRGGVLCVAFSPDGKTLASGAGDMMIKLWDPDTGKEIGTLKGHTFWVNSLAFSGDSKTLVSGGDKTVRLWDVA